MAGKKARAEAGLGVLLARANAQFSQKLLARFADQGAREISLAGAIVLLGVPGAGARISDLAGRAAVTKQAMGQLVRELAAQGIVEVAEDSSDRRARLVRPTQNGLALQKRLAAAEKAAEDEYAAALGRKRLLKLRGWLERLVAAPD